MCEVAACPPLCPPARQSHEIRKVQGNPTMLQITGKATIAPQEFLPLVSCSLSLAPFPCPAPFSSPRHLCLCTFQVALAHCLFPLSVCRPALAPCPLPRPLISGWPNSAFALAVCPLSSPLVPNPLLSLHATLAPCPLCIVPFTVHRHLCLCAFQVVLDPCFLPPSGFPCSGLLAPNPHPMPLLHCIE
jgi:hypothetical protein